MSTKSTGTIQIGLITGDIIFRNGLSAFIGQHENMKVVFAGENIEVLHDHLKKSKDLNICIADLPLHKEETARSLESFKHSFPQLKFVLFSNASHPYNIKKAIAIGCNGIISKYADAATLVKAILNVHYTGSFYESNMNPNELENSKNELITDMEMNVLKSLCSNKSNKEISKELNMSSTILNAYKNLLFRKLNVTSREMLIKCAYTLGLTEN